MRTPLALLLLALSPALALAGDLADSVLLVRITTESSARFRTERRVLAAPALPVGPGGLIMSVGFALNPTRSEDAALKATIVTPDGVEHPARLLGGDNDRNCTFFRVDPETVELPDPVSLSAAVPGRAGMPVLLIGRYTSVLDHAVRRVESSIEVVVDRPRRFYALRAGRAEWRGLIAATADGQKLVGFVVTRPAIGAEAPGALLGVGSTVTGLDPAARFAAIAADPPDPERVKDPENGAQSPRAKAWLGVNLMPFDADKEAFFGMPEGTEGALVTGVSPGSPSESAGIRVHDMIRSIGGSALSYERADDWAGLLRVVQALPRDKPVPCEIVRFERKEDGSYRARSLTLPITLTVRPLDHDEVPETQVDGLDIKVRPLTDDRRRGARLPGGATGVVVTAIARGSAAQLSGLRIADIVLSVDRKPVGDVESFRGLLEEARKAKRERVLLFVRRGLGHTFLSVAPQWSGK